MSLITRLQDEADLCRNEGASGIAGILEEAAVALSERATRATKMEPLTVRQCSLLELSVEHVRRVERAHGITS